MKSHCLFFVLVACVLVCAGCFDNRGRPPSVATAIGADALAASNRAAVVRVILRGDRKAAQADLAGCTAAETLDLSETGLKAIPPAVFKLKKLREFYFVRNGLTALPADVSALTDLAYLNLDGNALEKLPDELGALANLRWLRLNGNRLSTLPASVSKLADLRRIYLGKNRLTVVPESLKACVALEDISLDENPLATVPPWLVQLPHLKSVSLAGTRVAKLPADLSGWKGLSYLLMTGCPVPADEMKRIRAALPDVALVF